MFLVTSVVGGAVLGTVIFGSVDRGPELGTEALVLELLDVTGILVFGGFSVWA
jgi:hypothetical protein